MLIFGFYVFKTRLTILAFIVVGKSKDRNVFGKTRRGRFRRMLETLVQLL